MLKIIKNPDDNVYQEITQAVKDNDGYCPCMISKSDDTKCPCKEFTARKWYNYAQLQQE